MLENIGLTYNHISKISFVCAVFIFCDSVKSANAEFVRSDQSSKPYYLETFDVKLTCTGDPGDRLDIRLLVETAAERPHVRVLMVKKNEIKNATFDILNLHRYIPKIDKCHVQPSAQKA